MWDWTTFLVTLTLYAYEQITHECKDNNRAVKQFFPSFPSSSHNILPANENSKSTELAIWSNVNLNIFNQVRAVIWLRAGNKTVVHFRFPVLHVSLCRSEVIVQFHLISRAQFLFFVQPSEHSSASLWTCCKNQTTFNLSPNCGRQVTSTYLFGFQLIKFLLCASIFWCQSGVLVTLLFGHNPASPLHDSSYLNKAAFCFLLPSLMK